MYDNKNIEHMTGVIKIENGVWIGADTTIISGAFVGEGSIIGAKSLVNKKIPPFVVAAGVPIKVIKPRFKSKQQLLNTLQNTNSKYTLDEILNSYQEFGFYYE